MIAAQIKPHEDPMPDARETTTLLGLLDWAYRRQRVDADESRILHELEMLAGAGGSSAASVAQNGLLGCTIHGTAWRQRTAIHPDAVTVAAAVDRIAPTARWLIIQHARAGSAPEWTAEQAWGPKGRYDHDRGAVAGIETVRYPHGKTASIVVRWCPVEPSPDDAYLAMLRAEYTRWHRGLETLAILLADGLLSWRIDRIGASAKPWA